MADSDERAKIYAMKEVFTFPVMWQGWEMDNTGYVLEDSEGKRYVALTSHGRRYLASAEELYAKLAEYMDAASKTLEAMKLATLTEVSITEEPT